MRVVPILKGLATFVPFLYRQERGSTGGSTTARYCYSVWMRHAVTLDACGLFNHPRTIAELGPGDSLGIGLAGMLCGADMLYAFDVVRYANVELNLRIFDELLELVGSRAPVPDDAEFPGVWPKLNDYSFPHGLFKSQDLEASLHMSRVQRIREQVASQQQDDLIRIEYKVPWTDKGVLTRGVVDLVISQAALEHVQDIVATHHALAAWLRKGGVCSHVVDLSSHWLTPEWDGHLKYSKRVWAIIQGRRPYLLNRKSATDHVNAMLELGFEILRQDRRLMDPSGPPGDYAPGYQSWTNLDRRTRGLFVQGRAGAAGRQTADVTQLDP